MVKINIKVILFLTCAFALTFLVKQTFNSDKRNLAVKGWLLKEHNFHDAFGRNATLLLKKRTVVNGVTESNSYTIYFYKVNGELKSGSVEIKASYNKIDYISSNGENYEIRRLIINTTDVIP